MAAIYMAATFYNPLALFTQAFIHSITALLNPFSSSEALVTFPQAW